jgi:hypothetical protein
MNTIKVRIKSFEDMPPISKCCAETIRKMKPFLGQEVEVIPVPVKCRDHCLDCGFIREDRGFMYADRTAILFLDYMDIDEGGTIQ